VHAHTGECRVLLHTRAGGARLTFPGLWLWLWSATSSAMAPYNRYLADGLSVSRGYTITPMILTAIQALTDKLYIILHQSRSRSPHRCLGILRKQMLLSSAGWYCVQGIIKQIWDPWRARIQRTTKIRRLMSCTLHSPSHIQLNFYSKIA